MKKRGGQIGWLQVKGGHGNDGQTEKEKRGGGMAVVAKQYAFKDPVNTPQTQPHANDDRHLKCQIHNSFRSHLSSTSFFLFPTRG